MSVTVLIPINSKQYLFDLYYSNKFPTSEIGVMQLTEYDLKALLPELHVRTDVGRQAVRLAGVTASGFVRDSDVESVEELQLGFSL